jgi:hypothetical protein
VFIISSLEDLCYVSKTRPPKLGLFDNLQTGLEERLTDGVYLAVTKKK